MRIAVIADAHGNLLALQAVIADLRTTSPNLVVNLGDLATGPFDPAGCADVQMALGCPTVAGNHERNLLEGDDTSSSVAFARPFLSADHLHWIESLPEVLRLADDDVFACHGSPAGGDLDYLLDKMSSGRPVLASGDRGVQSALAELAAAWTAMKKTHWGIALKIIGRVPGTGGTAGADFLRERAERPLTAAGRAAAPA